MHFEKRLDRALSIAKLRKTGQIRIRLRNTSAITLNSQNCEIAQVQSDSVFCNSKRVRRHKFRKTFFESHFAMETSLHRQLKEKFRLPGSEVEVKLGRYRIDVVNDDRLVEIQHSGLSSIRNKVQHLVRAHKVDVVKPLVRRKRLIKLNRKNGKEVERRWSPKRGTILDLFDELIYFTRVFPHENLRLIVPMVEIEEIRFPGHGRRRRWRRNDFQVQDQLLVDMSDIHTFESAVDLHRLLPRKLANPFDTKALSEGLDVQRWQAQRIAYVLRKTGSANPVGKKGNAILYELAGRAKKPAARKRGSGKHADKKSTGKRQGRKGSAA